jgi:phenylacetate-coenzyme A ligase PaaK-like adenylate-forming protein
MDTGSMSLTDVKDKIFSIGKDNFDDLALQIFQKQAKENIVYKNYLGYLGIKPERIKKVAQIPFLPIELFKNHKIITGANEPQTIFESSGTTGTVPSRHFVIDVDIYNRSLMEGFAHFFGDPADYTFLALLPAYLERKASSLTYMMQFLMDISGKPDNGFYLYDHDKLVEKIERLTRQGEKIFFIGVSFGLLDFAEQYQPDLSKAIVMETGGMKGRRKELIREELHEILKKAFRSQHIMSEYGMTELLSQAYAKEQGLFETPPWMRFLIRDANDPFALLEAGQTGGLNIIDLSNINSCSFVAAQDLARQNADGRFEILGRFDNSDIRGCSLMYE